MFRFTSLTLALTLAHADPLTVEFDDASEGHLSLLQLRKGTVPATQEPWDEELNMDEEFEGKTPRNRGKMGMGKMGMGKMGMGKMGMGKMGMGMGMGKTPVEPEIAVDPAIEEEAAAVGDPHLSNTNGAASDLCCDGGVCEPCPVALMSQEPWDEEMNMDEELEGKTPRGKMGMGKMGMGMGKMGMGMGMGNGKTPAVDPAVEEEEAAAVGDPHLSKANGATADLQPEDLELLSRSATEERLHAGLMEARHAIEEDELYGKTPRNRGKMGMGKMGMGMGKMGMGKMGMGMGKMGMGMGMGKTPVEPEIAVDPIIEEEAAAVGDPHLQQTHGAKSDLCCTNGHCAPCEPPF